MTTTNIPAQAGTPVETETHEAPLPITKKRLSPETYLWALGLIALLVGAYGVFQRFADGLRVTDLGSYVPWGLWVATYEYFVWLEVGSLVVYTLLVYVFGWKKALPGMARTLYLTALAILAMALILIGLDLGHPFRFWHVLRWPQRAENGRSFSWASLAADGLQAHSHIKPR